MKIEKAAELFKKDIDKWLLFYKQRHEQNKSDWPMNQSEEEWFEDFTIYIQCVGEDK